MFVSPIYFSLLLFVALFILMYFFRKKYIPLRVPSNFLWEEVMNEQTASPYLKKLQKNLLFFLQLLVLLLLMLVLLQPRTNAEMITSDEVLFIIDLSPSMAREGHLERIKNEMITTLDRISSATITIVETGQQPTIAFYQELDSRKVKDYIETLELNNEVDNLENTMRFSRSLLTTEEVEVFVFTDALEKELVRKVFSNLKTTVFNSVDNNKVSLVNLVLTNKDTSASGYIVVKNHLQEAISGELKIYSEKKLIMTKQLDLLPEEEKGLTLEDVPLGAYYKASFLLEDSLLVDNEAFFVPTYSLDNVYMQSNMHYLIQKAVMSIYPYATTVVENKLASDGILLTNEFNVNSEHPFIYLHQGKEKVVLPSMQINSVEDPIFNYVDLNDVTILSAYTDLTISNLQTLISAENIPLILKGKTINGEPFIVINFDISDSDWPLHISFPLFFYNAITSLNEEHHFANISPNELMVISTINNVTILDENAKAIINVNPLKNVVQAPTKPGIYQAMYGTETVYFSVNIDPSEKQNHTYENFTINELVDSEKVIQEKSSNEYLRWLILIICLVMLVEWGVHIRGNRI